MDKNILNAYLLYDMMMNDYGFLPLTESDFPGLTVERHTRTTARGRKHPYYFFVNTDVPARGTVLFLPGVGKGHGDYLSELDALTRRGFRVLTLDYTGSIGTEDDGLISLYGPAEDVLELIADVMPEGDVKLIGHSLGGFTGAQVLAHCARVVKAVLISPLLRQDLFAAQFPEADEINAYEAATVPALYGTDVMGCLASTAADVLMIHSRDDGLVPFASSTGAVMAACDNPHLSFRVLEGRKHNPNYTDEALRRADEVFAEAREKQEAGLIPDGNALKAFFARTTMKELTEQDEEIWDGIVAFLG